MSNSFREFLKKVGSGPHTSKNLSREEAAVATRMMLLQEATPAQIGAFMIAHRIKRPTPEELAGMLDAYEQLGPQLPPIAHARPVVVFGIPYDGRSRTAPISPLTTLVLATAGCPVLLHGSGRIPTKYGIPLVEIWQGLGVDWQSLSLPQLHAVLEQTRLGLLYTPQHFPLAEGLMPYRDQIGKRPPFATLELIWSPYAGQQQLVIGFVHPPTEDNVRSALALRGTTDFLTVKGLEGSCDLPRDRTAILGKNTGTNRGDHPSNASSSFERPSSFERLLLHSRDYGFAGTELALGTPEDLIENIQSVLQGHPSEWMQAAIWNSGFYLAHCGICPDLPTGFTYAKELLTSGQVMGHLEAVRAAVTNQEPSSLARMGARV
ncbi:MAG: anthranilate phosphoribosyltransferase family protein [Leptolyngbyaceae bacterium]|nr:anthranilate phosphoribosyltransferase family protein [Leptolyngbyaceae bacterium]